MKYYEVKNQYADSRRIGPQNIAWTYHWNLCCKSIRFKSKRKNIANWASVPWCGKVVWEWACTNLCLLPITLAWTRLCRFGWCLSLSLFHFSLCWQRQQPEMLSLAYLKNEVSIIIFISRQPENHWHYAVNHSYNLITVPGIKILGSWMERQ